jgi:hypothetical protein
VIDPANIPAPAQVQSTLNAWHLVALGVGAFITHVYHTVVNAGGVKQIWRNFWSGPAKDTQPSTLNH